MLDILIFLGKENVWNVCLFLRSLLDEIDKIVVELGKYFNSDMIICCRSI